MGAPPPPHAAFDARRGCRIFTRLLLERLRMGSLRGAAIELPTPLHIDACELLHTRGTTQYARAAYWLAAAVAAASCRRSFVSMTSPRRAAEALRAAARCYRRLNIDTLLPYYR